MNHLEVFTAEIERHSLTWCRGENCHITSSHKRGFVMNDDLKTVHYDSQIGTRSTLHGGLHEIAHCIHNQKGMRRFESERQAEEWASKRMRELGIAVPRKSVQLGKRYVKRWKQFGDKIRNSRLT